MLGGWVGDSPDSLFLSVGDSDRVMQLKTLSDFKGVIAYSNSEVK